MGSHGPIRKLSNWPMTFESNRIGTADSNRVESRSFAVPNTKTFGGTFFIVRGVFYVLHVRLFHAIKYVLTYLLICSLTDKIPNFSTMIIHSIQ